MCLILWKLLNLVLIYFRKILIQHLLKKENKTETLNKEQPDNALLFTVIRPKEHHRKHPCRLINDHPLHISQRGTQFSKLGITDVKNWLDFLLASHPVACSDKVITNSVPPKAQTLFCVIFFSTSMLP